LGANAPPSQFGRIQIGMTGRAWFKTQKLELDWGKALLKVSIWLIRS
jgi:hypothetical protein